MPVCIYGAGGHSKAIYDIVKDNKKIIFFDEKKKFFKVNNKYFIKFFSIR